MFDVAAGFDADNPFARRPSATAVPSFGSHFRFGIPPSADLEFFGNEGASGLFAAAIRILEKAGGTLVEINFAPFRDAGRLLYGGPWLAERLHATAALLRENPNALLPVTRSIIEGGRGYSALDLYRAQYELATLHRTVDRVFGTVDILLLPTVGTIYQIAEIAAEPLRLNANLGLYTNFANLLDLAAIALPAGFTKAGLPFGFSLIAPAFADRALLDLGMRCQPLSGWPLGAGARQSSATA